MRNLLILATALAIAATWYLVDGRYSWLPTGKEGYALRVDRLTGTTLKCGTVGCNSFYTMASKHDDEEWRPVYQ